MAGDAVVGRLVALLQLDDKQFTAGMAGAEGQFTGLGQTASKFGSVLMGAMSVGAVLNFAKDCVESFAKVQTSLVGLATAVNATGASWSDFTAPTQEAISKGEELGFMAADTAAALETLTIMTGNAARAQELLGLAEDMARARGTDLASSASMVAKVAEGRIGIVSHVLSFLSGIKSADQAIVLMQQHFAGQSSAYADTTQGAIDRMSASWEGFKETLGSSIAPGVSNIMNGMASSIAALQNDHWDQALMATAFGSQTSLYIQATEALGLYGDEAKAFFMNVTPTPEIKAKMDEIKASFMGTGLSVKDATASVTGLTSAFADDSASAADVTQALADMNYQMTVGEATGNKLTDDVVAQHAAHKALVDYLKGGGKEGTAEYNQLLEHQTLATEKVTADADGMTAAQLRAAMKSGTLDKALGKTALAALAAAAEVANEKHVLDLLPTNKWTKVNVTVNDGPLSGLLSTLHTLTSNKWVAAIATSNVPTRASGGIFAAPSLSIIGEAGPEVVVPTRGDANSLRLLNAAAQMNGVTGGGGSSSVVITNYYTIPATIKSDIDIRDLAKKLASEQTVQLRAAGVFS